MKNKIIIPVLTVCLSLFAYSTSVNAIPLYKGKKVVVVKKRPIGKKVVIIKPGGRKVVVTKPKTRVKKTNIIRRSRFGKRKVVLIKRY